MASPTQQPETYPIWISQPILPEATEGNAYSYQFEAVDPDGDTITYSKIAGRLPEGLSISPSGLLSGIPTNIAVSGNYSFVVRADTRDGPGSDANHAVDRTFSLTVNDTNSSVVFNYGTSPYDFGNNELGEFINYDIDVSGDQPISLRLVNYVTSSVGYTSSEIVTTSGEQLSINGITVTFGTNNIFAVSDNINAFSGNTGVLSKVIDIAGSYYLRIYTIVSTGSENIAVSDVTAGITNTLFGLASISQAAQLLPAGLSISGTSINGVLTEAVGSYSFSLQAYNNVSTSEYSFDFSVVSLITPKPPVWLTDSDLGDYFGGQKTVVELNAVSPEGNTLTYALASGSVLPTGSSLSASGTLVVVAPIVEVQRDFSFTITVTDTVNSTTVNKTFFITSLVTTNIVDSSDWEIPAGSLGTIVQGEVSEFQLLLKGADNFTEFTINRGSLPPGLELNTVNGLITGRPFPVSADIDYNFEVFVYRYEFDDALGVPVRVHLAQLNRTFSITVLKKYNEKRFNSKLSLGFDTNDTRLLTRFVTDFLPETSVYRSSDENFGIQNKLSVPLNKNITLPCVTADKGIATVNTISPVGILNSSGDITYYNITEVGDIFSINGNYITMTGTTAADIINDINNAGLTNISARLVPYGNISLGIDGYKRYEKNQEMDSAFEYYYLQISHTNMTSSDRLLVSTNCDTGYMYFDVNRIHPEFMTTSTFKKEAHGLKDGQEVQLCYQGAGSLSKLTTYYVVFVDINTFSLAETPGGAVVVFTKPVNPVTIYKTQYANEISAIDYFYATGETTDNEFPYRNYKWLNTKEFPVYIDSLQTRSVFDAQGNALYDVVYWNLVDKFSPKMDTVGTSPTEGTLPFTRSSDPYSQPDTIHPASLKNINGIVENAFGFEIENDVSRDAWLQGTDIIAIPVVYTIAGQGKRVVDWFNSTATDTKKYAIGKKILIDRVDFIRYDELSWYSDRNTPVNSAVSNKITDDISQNIISSGSELIINDITVDIDNLGLTILNVIDTINAESIDNIVSGISSKTKISSVDNIDSQLVLNDVTSSIPSSVYGEAITVGTYFAGSKQEIIFHAGQYAISTNDFDIDENRITVNSHNFTEGDSIQFVDITVNASPSASDYYVYDVTRNTFKISTTYPVITPVDITSVVDTSSSRINNTGETSVSIKTFIGSLNSRVARNSYKSTDPIKNILGTYVPDTNKEFYISVESPTNLYFNTASINDVYKLDMHYGLVISNLSGGSIQLESSEFDTLLTDLKIQSKPSTLYNEIEVPFRYKKDKEI